MQVIPPLQVIEAHKGGIWSLCASPSGLIVTAGGDGLLKSWKIESVTGRFLPLAEVATPHTEVLLVRQSRHGVLISAGHDGGIATWELNPSSGSLTRRQFLQLSGDRQHYNDRLLETRSGYLLAWASGTVGHPALCRWSSAEQSFSFLQELSIERASVFLETPDGRLLSGDETGQIRCWRLDASSGLFREEERLQAHEGPVHALAWIQQEMLVSAGGHKPLLKVWSTGGGIGRWGLTQTLPEHQSQIVDVMKGGLTEVFSTDRGERSLLGWRRRPELLIWSIGTAGLHLVQRQLGRLRGLVDEALIVEEDGGPALSMWRRREDSYERIAMLDEGKHRSVNMLVPLASGMLVAGGLDGHLSSWDIGSA